MQRNNTVMTLEEVKNFRLIDVFNLCRKHEYSVFIFQDEYILPIPSFDSSLSRGLYMLGYLRSWLMDKVFFRKVTLSFPINSKHGDVLSIYDKRYDIEYMESSHIGLTYNEILYPDWIIVNDVLYERKHVIVMKNGCPSLPCYDDMIIYVNYVYTKHNVDSDMPEDIFGYQY